MLHDESARSALCIMYLAGPFAVQVEGDAKMLRKTTEQLAERMEALKKELVTQKEEFFQRLFEAQQENNQVMSSS